MVKVRNPREMLRDARKISAYGGKIAPRILQVAKNLNATFAA